MKKAFTLFILFFSSQLFADDIRSFVTTTSETSLVDEIDPGSMIFGIAFGTHEDDFIRFYGNPTGYIQLSKSKTGMLYGKRFFFYFENKMLSGVRITSSVLDWTIAKELKASTQFEQIKWKLNNGIQHGMSKPAIRAILGDALIEKSDYHTYFETSNSTVKLNFSRHTGEGESDAAYKLNSIGVHQK